MTQNGADNVKVSLLKLMQVCRLCSSRLELVSIFDKKFDFTFPMQAILRTITTVEIKKDDKISQKICSKCVSNIINMYQFRDQSIRNDQLLKSKYEKLTKTEEGKQTNSETPNKKDVKKFETNLEQNDAAPKTNNENAPREKNEERELKVFTKPPEEKGGTKIDIPKSIGTTEDCKPIVIKQQQPKVSYKIHPSVTSLFRQYSKIRVPTICLNHNMEPRVVLELNAVEDYFNKRNLDMKNHVQLFLNKPREVAVKHTLSKNPATKSDWLKKQNTDSSLPPSQPIKRKLSSSDSSNLGEGSVKKLSIIEFPKLSLASTQQLHICSICSAVHSYPWHLKRHMKKHLICQFCKSKFKTLELKELHVETKCEIKKIMKSMTNLPSIPLRKIETDTEITRKYLETFSEFDVIPNRTVDRTVIEMEKEILATTNEKESKTVENGDKIVMEMKQTSKTTNEKELNTVEKNDKIVVEIEKEISSATNEKESETVGNNDKTAMNIEEESSITTNEEESKTVKNNDEIVGERSTTTPTLHVDINIKDGGLGINSPSTKDSTDIKIIKNLLVQYNRIHRKVNDSSQTFLPTNELIKINHSDLTIELKHLQQHLLYYKIPTDIKSGSNLHVCYKNDSGIEVDKELNQWNDLTPTDVNFIYPDFYKKFEYKNIKQEINDEILIEDVHNLSLPLLQNLNDDLTMPNNDVIDVKTKYDEDFPVQTERSHGEIKVFQNNIDGFTSKDDLVVTFDDDIDDEFEEYGKLVEWIDESIKSTPNLGICIVNKDDDKLYEENFDKNVGLRIKTE